jgi:hypothetical protein
MSLLQETHSQYATFSDNVKCGSIDVADLVVTNSASIEGIDVTTTMDNTKVGMGAGVGSGGLDGSQNVSVGSDAGAAIASSRNVVVGYGAVTTGTCTGADEVIIGANAAPGLTTGGNNVVIGSAAGTVLTTGTDNVLIGTSAGSVSAVVGTNNVVVGSGTDLGDDFSGCVALGSGAIGPFTADNQLGVKLMALSTSATLGANGAVPAQVAFYLPIFIGGAQYMIPLFLP